MKNGDFYVNTEEPDVEHTFTDDEVQDLIDWLESLTLVDIAALKLAWESTATVTLQ